jgi:hypothetical protein
MSEADRRVDRALLAEVVLVLALVALGLVLFWRPAASGVLNPRWWHWTVLAVLFFSVVGLAGYRRRRRGNRALHEVIREENREHG